MAKRKARIVIGDEYLARRERAGAEEREEREEEPMRKVRKVDSRGRDMTKRAAQCEATWTARLNAVKQWKQTKGRFAKYNTKDKEETSLYQWLWKCVPGGQYYTTERWERLNETFGEGWEKECFPYLGTVGKFRPGNRWNPRDEATWDAILEEVLEFMRTNGRFPKKSGGDTNEVRLYNWLRHNADTTSSAWTRARHDKLIAALGERWRSECFPNSTHA